MNTTVRLRPALARQLGKIAAESNQDVSSLAEDALRQFVNSHRETVRLTRSRTNVQRLRAAHAEIETQIARRHGLPGAAGTQS
jgi:predicted transcriptional regulator